MKRVCITINLKNKILKLTKNKFEYFIEEHLNNKNFETITQKLLEDKINFIYIEELCIQKLSNLEEVLEFFKTNKVKVIIIYINSYNHLDNNYEINTIDIINDNFDNKIKEYETVKIKKDKKEQVKNFKFLNNTVLAVALDRKLYMTTYLLNVLNQSQYNNVLFVELKQSLIDYKLIVDDKINIKYKVIKNMKDLQKIDYTKYDKVVIDFGYVYNIKHIQQMLNNLNIQILVFETNCIKVWENPKYIQLVRTLEKYNNVKFINREEIFDKIIQESINPFKSKIIKKHVKKNIIGEF